MEFLERLGQLVGCQYISDLPRTRPGKEVLQQLDRMDVGQYSLEELAEAAVYITGKPKTYASREEALKAIAAVWTKR